MSVLAELTSKHVILLCLSSRLIMIVLQILLNHVIPDHQHSIRDVFWQGRRMPEPYNPLVEFLLGGFTRWDSEYFLHIAEHGYRYDQCLAFFPLYPATIYLSHKLFLCTLPFLAAKDAVLIAAVMINVVTFVLAGLVLFKLTNEMFRRPPLAHVTVLLYCINPASVFMTTTYSESLFSLLVMAGLWGLCVHRSWVAMVMFMLAGLTRSNGILLAGYVVWYHWLKLSCSNSILIFLNTISTALVQVAIVLSSFAVFQLVGYLLFCHDSPTFPGWCEQTIPVSYSYIQQHYWNNGWFKYYQLKQIPNFLLAAPTVVLCSYWLFCCYQGNWNKSFRGYSHWYWSNSQLIPLIGHMTFLMVFAVTNIHVQVITRLVYSSTPLVYWCAAVNILEALPSTKFSGSSLVNDCRTICEELYHSNGCYVAKTIMTHSLLYCVIGTLLHCNYYPWT